MLFKLFRSRYPQGSLVSELLQFEQGKYVVRVAIHLDRLVLGTGLGAADTVEEAEDRARERALALLDLEGTPSLPEARSLNGIPSHLSGQSSANALPFAGGEETIGKRAEEVKKEAEEIQVLSPPSKAASQNTHFSTPVTPPPVTSSPVTSSPVTSSPVASSPVASPPIASPSIATFEEISLEETETRSPEPEFDFPSSEPDPIPEMQVSPVPVEPPPIAIEPDPLAGEDIPSPPKIQALSEPIDFSEVLAQTNIEIRRLQWTQEQGRKFLLERYGKRSRQVLTDEELLDFLEYLKSQS